jgi:putative membrane protein
MEPLVPAFVGAAVAAVTHTSQPALAAPNAGQGSDQSDWYSRMHDGLGDLMGWGGAMFGGFGMLLFWGVIIALVVVVTRNFVGGERIQSSAHSGSAARDILKERYAKGEISKKEYEERGKTLTE